MKPPVGLWVLTSVAGLACLFFLRNWGSILLEYWSGWAGMHGPVLWAGAIWMLWRGLPQEDGNKTFSLLLACSCFALSLLVFLITGKAFTAWLIFVAGAWAFCGAWLQKDVWRRGWPGFGWLLLGLPFFLRPLPWLGASAAESLALSNAQIILRLMESLGIDVLREGPVLIVEGAVVRVGLHCAGIQYLEVVGALVCWRCFSLGMPKHWGTFMIVMTVAGLLTNLFRIFLVLLTAWRGWTDHLSAIDTSLGLLLLLGLLPLVKIWPQKVTVYSENTVDGEPPKSLLSPDPTPD